MSEPVPVQRVVLREERDKDDIRHLSARLLDNGDLLFEGQDLGASVEKFFGYREYEWDWTIKAEHLPAFAKALGTTGEILPALGEKFSGPNARDLKPFMEEHGIPFDMWSRVGD